MNAVTELAIKIREVLCMTDRYDREGAREVPLVDYWGDIELLIEKALEVPAGTLRHLGESGKCGDEDCFDCEND